MKTQPCDNCPDTIDVVRPPLEYQWVAVLQDDTEILQAPSTNEEKQFKDINNKNLKKFALRDWDNRDMFGIDVEERAFVLLGKYIRVDLPPGKYEVINIRRNPLFAHQEQRSIYIIGLKGEGQERYLYIYPDKHVEFSWRFK